MKIFAGILMGLLLTGSALAVTPAQAGFYTGTLTVSAEDYNVKKPLTASSQAVMMVELDGTTNLVADGVPNNAMLILGIARGVMVIDGVPANVTIKGKTLNIAVTVNTPTGPDNGVVVTYSFKMKRAKIQP